MKKSQLLPIGILAASAVALLASSAKATSISYSTGDLVLGFQQPGASNDYLVDIGPASYYIGLDTSNPGQTINISASAYGGLGLGNIASDLSSSNGFGASWATTGSLGTNVQWGIIGATSKTAGGTTGSGGTFGLPKDTLFVTFAETTPGTRSTAPLEYSNGTQNTIDTAVVNLTTNGNGFGNATTTANSNYAAFEATSLTNSWDNFHPGTTAFGLSYGIEQPSGAGQTAIGPTNSELDLYELLPTNAGGSGSGTYLGSFTLNGSGVLDFSTPVPEPSTFAAIGVGVAFLGMFRRHRKQIGA